MAAIAVSLFVTFLATMVSDETVVRGTSTIITVWDVGDELSTTEASQAIADAARASDLTIYHSVDGPVDGRPARTLQILSRGRDSSLPTPDEGYRDFSRNYDTHFGSVPPGVRDQPAGMYITGATPEDSRSFVEALHERGIDVTARSAAPLWLFLWTADNAPVIPLVFAALLSVTLGCVHATISARRSDAIRVAHGARRTRTIRDLLRPVVTTAVASGAGGLLVATPALGVYNGFAQYDRYLGVAILGIALVVCVAVAATMLVAVAEMRVPLLNGIARRMPLRRLSAGSLAIHAVASFLIFIVIGIALFAGVAASENRGDQSIWQAAPEHTLSFRVSNAEFDSNVDAIGELGRQAVKNGDAFIAAGSVGLTRGHGPSGGNSIVVDRGYLNRQPLILENGSRIDTSRLDPRALTLLIPADLRGERSSLEDEYKQWLGDYARGADRKRSAAAVPIRAVSLAPRQAIFNYSTDELTSRQVEPVIALLPSPSVILDNDWIASQMTSGGVIFSDTSSLERGLSEIGLGGAVIPQPIKDLAEARLAEQERVERANLVAAGIAALVMLLAAGIFATASTERRRQGDFVRFVHGGRGLAAVLWPTSQVAVLGLAALLAAFGLGAFPTAVAGIAAASLLVADVLVIAILLTRSARRLRRNTLLHS